MSSPMSSMTTATLREGFTIATTGGLFTAPAFGKAGAGGPATPALGHLGLFYRHLLVPVLFLFGRGGFKMPCEVFFFKVLLYDFSDNDVRLYALGLYGPSRGGVIKRGRKPDGRAVFQGYYRLHRTLAERRGTYYDGPFMVLKRARAYLRARP